MKSIVATAEQPERHTLFLQRFLGADPDAAGAFPLDRHVFELVTPTAAGHRFGATVLDHGGQLLLRGIVFGTADLEATRATLHSSGIDCEMLHDRLCVRPAPGQGAFIAFEADQ